ncbi:SDR family NAD(P)-dependent oxidoreductase [Georhizobium sp. MAB10]|uniref:SDR family NAD(P)-dependent oxidoreductase n=1 Tax=Georhizobium sp. MAB10 TaxID=3028319 RepID=UPI0038558ECC
MTELSRAGFDTWVNDAGVGLIATVDKTSTEDHQQIFQTNYFGVVHGSIAAVRYFRRKREPAALINFGSVVSDMPIPLSVAYSATKHAIKGFTDGLRNELMQEELPISVTLIKPSAIDTRFFDHAKTEMGGMGKAPGPHYAPEVVAAAIINAAQHQKRDFPVGATAVFTAAAEQVAPEFVDKQQSS